MSEPATYQIRTLQDIFNLPSFKEVELCLEEIRQIMVRAKCTNDALVALLRSNGHECERAIEWPEVIDWVDDGKSNMEFTVNDQDGVEIFTTKVIRPAPQENPVEVPLHAKETHE
jgi:hypothetical protein